MLVLMGLAGYGNNLRKLFDQETALEYDGPDLVLWGFTRRQEGNICWPFPFPQQFRQNLCYPRSPQPRSRHESH